MTRSEVLTDDEIAIKSSKPSEDRFRAIRARYKAADEACNKLYSDAADDFKFAWVPGNQWDDAMSALRGDRPKYEFNNLRQSIKQVLNDNRQNTPSIKVAASEDSSVDLAEMREGIIRNIESQSNADGAYDWGALYAITAGFGCWRVVTEYTDDDAFEQDIRIRRIENPFSVKFDPSARKLDRSDGRYLFIEQTMPRSVFKAKWPDADIVSFEPGKPGFSKDMIGWAGKDDIRVCEYWQKKRKTKTIYQLSDGRVVDAEPFDLIKDTAEQGGITIKAKRSVEYDEITTEIISGIETLEGPTVWAGKYIPVIPCWGDIVNVDGADYWYGMVRPSRDAQTLFNFSQSNLVEVVAAQPRAPWLYTPKMVEGHEKAWENAAVGNAVGLPYNPDAEAPGGKPSREMPPQFSNAWFELAKVNADNLKSTTGIYDASLGQRSNETSGVAISNRARQSGLANFDYQDNIAKAVQFTGVIVNDLMQHIYDTERDLRILGADQQTKYIKINQPMYELAQPIPGPDGQPIKQLSAEQAESMQPLPPGKWIKTNDLSAGKYDVTITTGPSFTTQRMETQAALSEIARNPNPQIAALASYGVMKNMDVPGMEEITKGIRAMLVAQKLLEPGDKDPPPQGPPPEIAQAMQQIQEQGQQLAQEKAALDAQKAEMSGQQAKLQAAQSTLNADFGQKKAELENMLLKAQASQPQEAPQTAPAAPNGTGEAAIALANTQANQALVLSLGPVVESMQGLVAGMSQVAPAFVEGAQMLAAANAPKQKVGQMVSPDGRVFEIRVAESN